MSQGNSQNGASATAKRTPASRGVRPSSSAPSRPRKKAAPRTGTRAKSKRPATARIRPTRPWWTIPAAVVVVVVVFAWTYYPVVRVQYRETREQARLAAELRILQARNDRLREEVDRLKTPEGVEDYARSQLGLVKKGERVVVVVDGATRAAATDRRPRIDSDETIREPVGPWTGFLDLVFGVE